MGNYNTKFRIKTDKHPRGWWSFGACISHAGKEIYLYINLFRLCISIGFLYEEDEEYFVDNII